MKIHIKRSARKELMKLPDFILIKTRELISNLKNNLGNLHWNNAGSGLPVRHVFLAGSHTEGRSA
jgi:mRNA-degrading endonuclease RelE of RelBE toxin-antitoxin system